MISMDRNRIKLLNLDFHIINTKLPFNLKLIHESKSHSKIDLSSSHFSYPNKSVASSSKSEKLDDDGDTFADEL